MNKLKIAIKSLEVAANIILLISTGKEIVDSLKKKSAQSKIIKRKSNAV